MMVESMRVNFRTTSWKVTELSDSPTAKFTLASTKAIKKKALEFSPGTMANSTKVTGCQENNTDLVYSQMEKLGKLVFGMKARERSGLKMVSIRCKNLKNQKKLKN